MRKRIFDEECNLLNSPGPISAENLNFTLSSVTQVFYDDKYKVIMCAAPKAATTNWQKMMAVLKYDGIYDTDHFRKSNVCRDFRSFHWNTGRKKEKVLDINEIYQAKWFIHRVIVCISK